MRCVLTSYDHLQQKINKNALPMVSSLRHSFFFSGEGLYSFQNMFQVCVLAHARKRIELVAQIQPKGHQAFQNNSWHCLSCRAPQWVSKGTVRNSLCYHHRKCAYALLSSALLWSSCLFLITVPWIN